MMAEPLAAALHGVAKHYHGFTLGPLNLEIPAGSIVGLIGENGAGKTTLLKLLTGVNRPDAGTVELLSATPDDAAVRAKIGVVFEDAYFYESLTPAQVGTSLRGIFGPAWDAGYFAALLEQFHLPPKKSIKELSRGMRMKLNLASALAHRPGLLVLDEATASCIYTQKGNKKIRKPQAANQTALIFDRRAAARLLSINSIRRLCWS